MNKKNMKIILILVSVCVCYGLLFYFLSGSNKATEGYLIVSELGGFHCKAKICTYEKSEEIPNNKTFQVYQQNKLLGSFTANYERKWNFFGQNNWQSIYGDFLGISESLQAKIHEYKTEEFQSQDIEWIQETLKAKGISSYEKLLFQDVVIIDLNGDGLEDRIISATNQNTEMPEDTYFTMLLFVLNEKKLEMYFEKSETRDLPIYTVFSILSLDEEKNPRIIFNKGYFDQMGSPSLLMLQADGKNMKELVSSSANS